MQKTFISGLKISENFFKELVEPLLQSEYPNLKYSAGLIGPGSEVLGFDTETSTDHDWRPRVFIFLSDTDFIREQKNIENILRKELPKQYQGYDLQVSKTHDLRARYVYSVRSFVQEYLNIDISKSLKIESWLTCDEHRLLGFTSGKIFRDDTNELDNARRLLAFYPRDIWLYSLASQWTKIAEEESFVGRAGHIGDELGSQIIATRVIQSMIRLCFLYEKKYAPYSKWFGSGFAGLSSSKRLSPIFDKVLASTTWKLRETALSEAYEILVRIHNATKLTPVIKPRVHPFHERPYQVIGAGEIAKALRKRIKDRNLKEITLIGSVNQLTDNVLLLESAVLRTKLSSLYIGI